VNSGQVGKEVAALGLCTDTRNTPLLSLTVYPSTGLAMRSGQRRVDGWELLVFRRIVGYNGHSEFERRGQKMDLQFDL
jgi:hypothetical protein